MRFSFDDMGRRRRFRGPLESESSATAAAWAGRVVVVVGVVGPVDPSRRLVTDTSSRSSEDPADEKEDDGYGCGRGYGYGYSDCGSAAALGLVTALDVV
jgi:hypothetical protein